MVDSCRTGCSVAAAVGHWSTSVCASVDSAVPRAAAAALPSDAAACSLHWLPARCHQHLTVDLFQPAAGHTPEADCLQTQPTYHRLPSDWICCKRISYHTFRPQMQWTTATDVARVCLCTGHTDVLCKNSSTDRDAGREPTRGPKDPCIRWGSRSHMGMGKFRSCPAHWKALGISAAVYEAVLNNGTTARLLQPTAILPTGRCHITLSHMKNPPPSDAVFCQNSLTSCYSFVIIINIIINEYYLSATLCEKSECTQKQTGLALLNKATCVRVVLPMRLQ